MIHGWKTPSVHTSSWQRRACVVTRAHSVTDTAYVVGAACTAVAASVTVARAAWLGRRRNHTHAAERQDAIEEVCPDTEPWMRAVAQRVMPSTAIINLSTPEWLRSHLDRPMPAHLIRSAACASGIVWDAVGHVVTNYHVYAGKAASEVVSVTLNDGHRWRAYLVGCDVEHDLAVLQIVAPPDQIALLRPMELGRSARLAINQQVLAIGNSWRDRRLSTSADLFHGTLTQGTIGWLNATVTLSDNTVEKNMIVSSAPTYRGSSGGPLLDSEGRCIGVNTSGNFDFLGLPLEERVTMTVPVDTVCASVKAILLKHEKECKKLYKSALAAAQREAVSA